MGINKPLVRQIIPLSALLLFAALFLFIAWNNRLTHGDDMLFLLQVQEKGILDSILDFNYNKRYSSFFIFNLVFSNVDELMDAKLNLFVYHVLFLSSYLLAIWSFSKALLKKIKVHEAILALELTAIIALGLFFFLPQLIEIWFWAVGSIVYGIPVIFAFLGFSELLKEDSKPIRLLLMVVSFFIVGGALETFAILISSALFTCLILALKNKWKRITVQKLLLALLSTLALLLLNLFDGGITSRIALESIEQEYEATTLLSVFKTLFDKNNLLILPLLLLFFFLGSHHNNMALKVNKKSLFLVTASLLMLSATITFLPLTRVFNGLGPHRAWMPFHFSLFLVLLTWSFVLGQRFHLRSISVCKSITWIIVSILLTGLTYSKLKPLQNYSSAYDATLTDIMQKRDAGIRDAYIMKELPEPDYLVRFSITADSTHWYNSLFKDCMKSDFAIVTYSNEQIE